MNGTIKQYTYFAAGHGVDGNLIRPEAWDFVRMKGDPNSPFALPTQRQEWQNKIMDNTVLNHRADDLVKFIRAAGYKSVHSFGVGGAGLEFLLKKKLGKIVLKCSDYAPETVELLRGLFPEADGINCFDMATRPFPVDHGGGLHLLYRIDAEFSDEQWRGIFQRMAEAGVTDVLFIPNRLIVLKDIIKETIKGWLKPLIKGMTFAGYVRTKKKLLEIWKDHYCVKEIIPCGNLVGFVLNVRPQIKI